MQTQALIEALEASGDDAVGVAANPRHLRRYSAPAEPIVFPSGPVLAAAALIRAPLQANHRIQAVQLRSKTAQRQKGEHRRRAQ